MNKIDIKKLLEVWQEKEIDKGNITQMFGNLIWKDEDIIRFCKYVLFEANKENK